MQAWKVFQKQKVGELCKVLAAHSMDTTGIKSVLVARLAKTTSTHITFENQVVARLAEMHTVGRGASAKPAT